VAKDLKLLRRLADSEHNLAVISVTRADGSVHSSVVNAGLIDDPVSGKSSVGVVIRGGTVKQRALRRDPRATVVFRRGWEWVAVAGRVRMIGPDDKDPDFDAADLPKLLRQVFKAAGGKHHDWAEYDRVMAEQRRTVVLVKAARISSNG
jgi:PPOX class probable F420-dependent enzyme